MKTITFKSAKDLVDYCNENNIYAGQVWVESNPKGLGKKALLSFYVNDESMITDLGKQHDIDNVDYAWHYNWDDIYRGTFELVIPDTQFTKPEVYKVGDNIKVLGSVKEIGSAYPDGYKIGRIYEIMAVHDNGCGVYYACQGVDYYIPFYCVKKVEAPILKEMRIEEIQKELGYKIKIIE
jgi:hypothetical protein